MATLDRRLQQLERVAGVRAGQRGRGAQLSKAELARLAQLAARAERGRKLAAGARKFLADVERRTGHEGLRLGAAIRRLEIEV